MPAGADPGTRGAPARALPPDGEAHLWLVDLASDDRTRGACRAVLSEGERAREERFRSADDAARFVTAHGHLRCILGLYAGAAASRLVFSLSPFGKPSLDGPEAGRGIRFNMSDAGDLALVAVTRDREIGVDIERIDARPDLESLAVRCFCPAERGMMSEAPVRERPGVFTTLWARKEAYIKGRGEGMSLDLRAIDVSRAPAVLDGRWRIDDLGAPAGYRSALAVDGGSGRFTQYAPAESAGALFNREQ